MPPEIKNLPPANKLANLNNKEIIIKSANITGEILNKSGFNLNFAPVLDIKRFDDNHAIGDRCYGDTKEKVSEYAVPVMKELQSHNIVSVIKHFPGHGATKQDSHALLPIISSDIKTLQNEDMFPFEQAIKEGADAILIGHLLIRKITGFYPTSLSRTFITKYLRKKYRYRGLIITDDLKMKAIKLIYGPDLAVEKAFKAGNDIIIFRFSENEEKRIINKIVNLVSRKKIKETQINRSIRRILKIKEKYNITDDYVTDTLDIDKLNNEIEEIRKMV